MDETQRWTTQMKATEKYFHVVQFIIFFKVVLTTTFEFSGPYSDIQPAKLTNHGPRTNREIK